MVLACNGLRMSYHWLAMNQVSSESRIDRLSAHPVLISFFLVGVALILRMLAIGRYVTPDELIWVYRSVQFREAIRAGQWADTLVAGHPGVTTTWLGSIAIGIQLAIDSTNEAAYDWVTHLAYLTPDNMTAFRQLYLFLDAGRTAVAIVNCLGVVAIYWLVRQLWDAHIALFAALAVAIDPFVAGLSGLLHVDSLLATWSIISLMTLALGVGFGKTEQSNRRRVLWIAASGAAVALAILSKSPGVLLLPLAVFTILSLLWREKTIPLGRRSKDVFIYGAVWLSSFLLVLIAIYPALWDSPIRVLNTISGNAGRHVDEALRPTFFMGDVAYDHGFLFYPVALLWRLSPLIVAGLFLLLPLLIRRRDRVSKNLPAIVLLSSWVIIFLVSISFAAKKFDRYALPVVPVIVVLAAVGLAGFQRGGSKAVRLFISVLAVAQLATLAVSTPYLLSAYNPLVGGPFTAQLVLPLGWGESVSASGRWLSSTSEAATLSALSGIAPSLAPFFLGDTRYIGTDNWQTADRIILTANSRQVDPELVSLAERELELSHTVIFGLLPQAWIYINPDPQRNDIVPQDLPNRPLFGDHMQLVAQYISEGDQHLLYTAVWQKKLPAPRLAITIRLMDGAGDLWQELETEILNEVYFYPEHWQPAETPVITYRLRLPQAMPPGTYDVVISLIDLETGGHLPVHLPDDSGTGVSYVAGTIELDVPSSVDDLDALEMISVDETTWPQEELQLLGFIEPPKNVLAGDDLRLELIWLTHDSLPPDMKLALQLDNFEYTSVPLSNATRAYWDPEWVVRQKYHLPISASTAPGDYTVYVAPIDSEGKVLIDSRISLGNVHVNSIERLFAFPENIEIPLDINYEHGIALRGISPATLLASKGASVPLTLYWQAEQDIREPVTAFIHILDANEQIVAQVDRWPGGLPSDIWSPGQVITDEYELTLPEDLLAGSYTVAIGLYTASDGNRLQAFDSSGTRLPDDRYLLPITLTISE